ncbi:MAG: hypothetical protein O2967_06280 [Proteobacteria bacterium]|nr:hypothetical protein [Pseudomonadota bacterium]
MMGNANAPRSTDVMPATSISSFQHLEGKGPVHLRRPGCVDASQVPPDEAALTFQSVETLFTTQAGRGPRKMTEVTQKDEDTITAQIITIDGSRMQTFKVDRHSGMGKRLD